MKKLDAGTQFPTMTLNGVDGGQIAIPTDFSTPYQILLFYRGHW